MMDASVASLATSAAQSISAAVVALVLFGFYRQYGKSYLAHWTTSWVALSLFEIAAAAGMWLAAESHMPAASMLRLGISVTGGAAGYLQLGFLAFGTYEIVRRRPVRLRSARLITMALALTGIAVASMFIESVWAPQLRYATRVGLHSFVASVTFIGCALALWRGRKRRSGVGFFIMSLGLFVYGAEELHYASLSVAFLFGPMPRYTQFLGYLDFLLQSVVAIGMVACLLEDEREAAELATVEIEHLAYHDALTGLPNRPLFIDRLIVALAQAARSKHKLAVLFLDLDRFKDINDSLGHSIGDTLLKAVAERIRHCTREGDTVARFGGDEFTLMLPKVDKVEDVAKVAQKVIETLKIPFIIGERELFVSTSIGISLFPGDGDDPETLVRNADSAMYRAKEQGRDNYQLYAPAMNARALERLALENMLRKAVANGELVVYYQPLVALDTRRIHGVEALVRWQHPELGLLLPAHFISVAEMSGLIVPIGAWVLETACRQVRAWQKRLAIQLTVSVNLSARQFQQADLVAHVSRALDVSGLAAESLELEITESSAMQNADNTIYVLRDMKLLGVRIAMDDFGTGYSSLNYLKRFPIDTLKLDQSFVRDIETDRSAASIVSAVIALAHSLNLEVVAEGVETEEQLDFLSRRNCDRIQGFLFSAPLSAEELEPFLTERARMHA